MKTSSIRSNIFQKPFATGAPPQTPLREIPLDPLLKNCVAPLTLRSKSIGHFDCCPIREKVKQNSLYKKSNIIDYQYNPILFIFCLGTPNILCIQMSEYWHATLKRFATPALALYPFFTKTRNNGAKFSFTS